MPLAGKANKKSNHDFPTNHSGCCSVFRLSGSAPVMSGRHLGVAVEGAEVLEGDGAVEVADGHPVEESELSVDAPHRRRGPLAGGNQRPVVCSVSVVIRNPLRKNRGAVRQTREVTATENRVAPNRRLSTGRGGSECVSDDVLKSGPLRNDFEY